MRRSERSHRALIAVVIPREPSLPRLRDWVVDVVCLYPK